MQKDFKIGLAIGVTLAAGAVIWLSTLPRLSARARALEAASNATPSPKTLSYVTPSQPSPDSEIRNTNDEIRDTPAPSDEPQVTSDDGATHPHCPEGRYSFLYLRQILWLFASMA